MWGQPFVSEEVVQAGTDQEAHAFCVQSLQIVALCRAPQPLSRQVLSCVHMSLATTNLQAP